MARKAELSFTRMTNHIESMIAVGEYRAEDRLPPLRDLCDQFEVNLDTARRGIWHLRDKGLLECRRGSGVYVKRQRQEPAEGCRIVVLLHTTDLTKTYCAHVYLAMQQAALQSRTTLTIRTVPLAELAAAVEAAAGDNDAVVLLGNYDAVPQRPAFRRPAVGVEMHRMYDGAVSAITLDPINAAELAAGYFRERGIRSVRLFSEASPAVEFRAKVFMDRWRADGGEVDYRLGPPAFVPGTGALADRDVGYLFTGGDMAERSGRVYRERFGRSFSDDRVALSMDGKSRILPSYEPIDTIATDWSLAGQVALDEAMRRVRHPGSGARRIYLDVKLETKGDAGH